jgi:hypothetical protein
MLKTTLLSVVSLAAMAVASGSSDEIDYKYQYYHDNNMVNVHSNVVNIKKRLNDNFSVSLGGLIDAISGASRKDTRGFIKNSAIASNSSAETVTPGGNTVDATTSASKTDEKRFQPSLTIIFFKDFFKGKGKESNSDNPTTITVTGINSSENDYLSRTISGSLSQDLFERNTTIGVRAGKTFNTQFPASRFVPGNDNAGWNYFGEGTGKRQTDNISASLTQGITTTTIVQLVGGYSYDRGYMAKPFYVYKMNDQFRYEKLPVCRNSYTLTALINQYIPLGKGFSLHCNYRYYEDSWAQKSHTIEGELYSYITDNLVIRPSGRFYTQTSSFFYKDAYDSTDTYLTTDLKYRGGKTWTAGLKLSYIIKDFVKPEGGGFFSFFPVSIDLGFDYFLRESPDDPAVLAHYYQYYGAGDNFRAFWIQSGIRFVF